MMRNNNLGWHWRSWTAVVLLAIVCLGTVSCKKRCRCVKNNMTVDYYSTTELDQHGKSCSEMVYIDGLATKYYSLCEWEY